MIPMTQPDRTSPSRQRSPRLRIGRRPVAIAAAGALGLGAVGAPRAVAQSEAGKAAVVAPYARAPLTFADMVEKVRPAVISIHVKNGQRRSGHRNFEFRGMPDLPEDHPRISASERTLILSERSEQISRESWASLLRYREFWGLLAARG